MPWLRISAIRLRSLFLKPRLESELDDELGSHIQMLTDENLRKGLSPEEARHAAMRAFGGLQQVKEVYREQRGLPLVETIGQDLRYAVRSLRKNPAFAAVTGITFALGIGANTAIFSLADAILTRPVSLPDLDRLVAVVERTPPSEDDEQLAPANYLDVKAGVKSFTDLAAYRYWSATLTGQGEPAQIECVRVSANFFTLVGERAALGRSFLAEEQEPGNDRVVVLSDGFWKRKFGGDPAVLGRTLRLDDQSYTIVGIMPRTCGFPRGGQNLWTPLALGAEEKNQRARRSLSAVGRLRPGTPIEHARAEVATIWNRLEKQYADENAGHRVMALELRDHLVSEDDRRVVLLLLGAVGFVLLIACANVANLQLARAAGRQREIALRSAIGAGRSRIVRQLLTESLVLSLLGATFGLLLAVWGVSVLRTTMPAEISAILDLNTFMVDARALAFAFCIATLAGLLSGVAPAWQHSRSELNDALKEGSGRSTGSHSHRMRRVFVVAEVALALILLIGAGLMVKGFVALAGASPELQPERLLTFTVALSGTNYTEPRQFRTFYRQALERIRLLPAVQSAAIVSGLPYSFYDNPVNLSVEGQPPLPPGQLPSAMLESISGDYFRTMHIALRQGREFDERDSPDGAPVAVISETMARRLWPGRNPMGKRLKLGTLSSDEPWVTVIGIAADTRHEVYDRSFRSVLYRPFQQTTLRNMDFAVRTAAHPMPAFPSVREAISQIDKNRPVAQVESMATKIRTQASALRYVAALMGIFGMIALALAAVGVYGVMAYSVTERRQEIGIRMALGAQRADVLLNVLSRGFTLAAAGLAIGVPAALVLAQLLSNVFYGVSTWDAMIFVATPGALTAIALIASYIPARRATKVDPIVVLRYE